MMRILSIFGTCGIFASAALMMLESPSIPKELCGRWEITRALPSGTITCFDDKQERALLHTELEYEPTRWRWKEAFIQERTVTSRTLSANEFSQEYSGSGPYYVNFKQLGIKTASIVEIKINDDMDGTDIPGELIFLKDPNHIVVTACNDYFEATRKSAPTINSR